MLNRTSKLTALMVAATSVVSMATPVLAAEKLGTKEGTITNAIAFDGTFVFDGYRTDDDDSGLYFNNGKDKMVDEMNKLGDFEWFVSDDPYIPAPKEQKMDDFMNIPVDAPEEIPFDEDLPFA